MERLGDYRLGKRLAIGGMGEVYLGEKIGPEGFVKPVVLKCVRPELTSDPSFVQLFLDEARLAAVLSHPNIAQVFDFGRAENTYYIAMEYVPGYTVDAIRRKIAHISKWMPVEHIACVASQVCQGLHYAHTLTDARGVGLGLVHRDVSPHNLIVSTDGSVKIVDFGIAKARAGLARVQATGKVGKFTYMSPEQARGAIVDARSDIFALGVCLWELATNRRLHDPKLDRPPEYSAAQPIPSIEEYRDDVPMQFQKILDKALAIELEDRYANCREMHLDLERFLAAMTHFAGQSALAGFVRELVEGTFGESGDVASGDIVEPAAEPSPPRSAVSRIRTVPAPDRMAEAQKYEEVFGSGTERQRSRLRAVPKSWDTDALARDRFAEDAEEPDVGLVPVVRTPVPRKPSRPRSPSDRDRLAWPWLQFVLLTLVLASLGFAAYRYRAEIGRMFRMREVSPAQLGSAYRFETSPAGARVFLDDEPIDGVTPIEVSLIPDVDYRVTVRLTGHATRESIVKAEVADRVRTLRFELERAATLVVHSSPPGAQVTVDGRRIRGRATPMVVDDVAVDREISVIAVLGRARYQTRTVRIAAGARQVVEFDFDAP